MSTYTIAFLLSTPSKGGITRFVVEVVKRLLRKKYRVFVVSWYFNFSETFPELKKIPLMVLLRRGKGGTIAVNLHRALSGKQGRVAPTLAGVPISVVTNLFLVIYTLLKLKPNFVVVNTGHSLICIAAALSRLLLPHRKVIFILYYHAPPSATRSKIASCIISIFEKASMRVAIPVANSRAIANTIKCKYGVNPTVIHMGVDPTRFKPISKLERSDSRIPVLLYVARFQPDKKHFFAIWLMRKLRNQGLKAKLILAGSLVSEFEYYLKRLKDFTKYLGVEDLIEFKTNLTDRELLTLYDLATIYIHVRPEAFGISILEALSCGKPVIVYKEGGQSDFVIHGVNGFLAGDSLNEWVYYIKTLLCDKTLYTKMSNAARKVAERFTWDKTTERIEILLRTLKV